MRTSLSPEDHAILLAEADAAALRLRRRLRLTADAAEDVRQDLLLDLIRRTDGYDPTRGPLGPFAGRVLRNRAAELAAAIVAERRTTLALDADHAACLVEAEDDDRDGRLSLDAAVRRLPRRDRAFCLALSRWSVDRLAAAGWGSRAGLYRRLHDLRCRVAALGLAA